MGSSDTRANGSAFLPVLRAYRIFALGLSVISLGVKNQDVGVDFVQILFLVVSNDIYSANAIVIFIGCSYTILRHAMSMVKFTVINKICFFVLTVLLSNIFIHAVELRPLISFQTPAELEVQEQSKDVGVEYNYDTDFLMSFGAEFIFAAEFAPFKYGLGTGYLMSQNEGGKEVVPGGIPLWGLMSVGIANDDWFAEPYFDLRAGWVMPASTEGSWWEKPANFYVTAGLGAILPLKIGVEAFFSYTSMVKSFDHKDLQYRASSARFGLMLSMGFNLTHDRVYAPRDSKIEESEE
ncbi:MAG: hypothetical protein MJY98_00470 [Fibrobacter sp.]|nr:hypothetical protein [Fibrobacter sp.]